MKKKPLILAILDGFGIDKNSRYNAIKAARTPNLDMILKRYSTVKIHASGNYVGLPENQTGNSEVGHMSIGTGQLIYQDLTRINDSIKNKDFFKNQKLTDTIKYVLGKNSTLHLMGLLSDGGTHSKDTHLYALLKLIKNYNLKKVCLHLWLDGRDAPPKSAKKYISECTEMLKKLGVGNICTICGRYYSMDRNNNWDRTIKAYKLVANADGIPFSEVSEVIENSYENGITDEFIVPHVHKDYNGILSDDALICFNFRPDRVRQITRCFADKNLPGLDRDRIYLKYVSFTQYDKNMSNVSIVFEPKKIEHTLGKYIADKGLKQLRIAETEKYAHVTFFFNGGRETPYENEDRILIDSPKVATYDSVPEMSAYKITEELIKQINNYDIITVNYANGDMVGHTGVFEASVKAVETVDKCIGTVYDKIIRNDGVLILTADHGNVEKMRYDDGTPHTSHTNNLVPLCLVNYNLELKNISKLSDIKSLIIDIINDK